LGEGFASATVSLCSGSNVAGKTFSAKVYIPTGSPSFNVFSSFQIVPWNSAESSPYPADQYPASIPLGQWSTVTGTIQTLASSVADHISFRLNNNSASWGGIIYLDDVTIN
jgi:hypothetical protein